MLHHPSYKRSHYYMVLLIFVVILTAMYVVGITQLLGNHKATTIDTTASSVTTSSTSVTDSTATSSMVVTKIFGSPVVGDIGAGSTTVVAFVTQETGGSGTFFYAIAFLNKNNKFANTNPVFLGDRIAPQGLSISGGIALFNYCERNPGEPFTTQPSQCVTKRVSIIGGSLVEVKQ